MKSLAKIVKTKFAVIIFIAVFLVLSSFILLSNIYLKVKVANNTYFFVSPGQIEPLALSKVSAFYKKNIVFFVGEDKYIIPVSELGVNFSEDLTDIKTLGFKNSLLENFKNSYFVSNNNLVLNYTIDKYIFLKRINEIVEKYEELSDTPRVIVESDTYSVLNGKRQRLVDLNQIAFDLGNRIRNLTVDPISILIYDDDSQIITDEQLITINSKLKNLSQQKILLNHSFDSWDLLREIPHLLSLSTRGDNKNIMAGFSLSTNIINLESFSLYSSVPSSYGITYNEEDLVQLLLEIATVTDQVREDATLRFENGRVFEFSAARDGRKLDISQSKKLIGEKLSVDFISEEKTIDINLPVSIQKAKIANEKINNLGVNDLIGSGVSYFAGSIANRAYNINLGASRVTGILVKPGGVFSFNESLGEISNATGYKQAYVITSGRTELDDGGGICQVSTTFFRAALNAGLPILARTAHAYRVSYYEQKGFKPGFDATIWQPSVDLKFKNDTKHHILVQTTIDKSLSKLQVDIYGTLDGRYSEISIPVVTNIRPAPEPLYQDDASLPSGVVKQIDFAASGATSVFTRKVYRNQQLLYDDVFRSNFRPWQAVYLVGTGG